MQTHERTYKVAVPGTTDSLSILRGFVVESSRRAGLSEVESGQVEIAVCEACSNIIEHAYRGAPDKMIQVQFAVDPNQVVITIRDESLKNHPVDRVEVITVEEFLKSDQKRGLGTYIIRNFVDRVEHSFRPDRGNRLRLTVYR